MPWKMDRLPHQCHIITVRDGTTTEKEGVAYGRSAVAQIIGVCGIKECNGAWVSTVGKTGRSASMVERMKLEGGREVSGWDRL